MWKELILDVPHRQVVFTIPQDAEDRCQSSHFIENHKVIDKIIDHLKLIFAAEHQKEILILKMQTTVVKQK